MLIHGNVINQEVLRLVCCTEEIPVGAPGTWELPLWCTGAEAARHSTCVSASAAL